MRLPLLVGLTIGLLHSPSLSFEADTKDVPPKFLGVKGFIYPNASLQTKLSDAEFHGFSGVYTTSDDFDKVVAWYKKQCNHSEKVAYALENVRGLRILQSDSSQRDPEKPGAYTKRSVRIVSIVEYDADSKIFYLFVISRVAEEKETHISITSIPMK